MQKTLSLAFAAAVCGVPPPSPSVAVLSQTNIDNTQLAFNWPKGLGLGLDLGLVRAGTATQTQTQARQPLGAVCRMPPAACRLPFAVCSCLKSHINNENCTVAKSLNGKILQASTLLPLLLPCSNAVGGGTTLCCTAAHTSVCGKVIGLRALCA